MGYFQTLRHAVDESTTRTGRGLKKSLGDAHHGVREYVLGAPRKLSQFTADTVRFYRKKPRTLAQELVSGFTIAILQIPESVAFSFVAGVDPIVGLRATVFMGFVCGLLGARPGMVSGAAGAMAVILADLSGPGGRWADRPKEEVTRLVYMTMILTGAIQFGIGMLGLARFSKLIPFTAMIGFMNGLAIIILISQLDAFKECPGEEYSVCARADTLKWRSLADGETWLVIVETIMAAITVTVFPRWKKVARYVPAALVALVLVTVFEHAINRPLIKLGTRTVSETSSVVGKFIPPGIPKLPDDTPWSNIVTYAIIMGVVGIVESVMTSDAVAELLQEPNGPFASTQDTLAQGVGNFISGLFGSMGGDAMIGQSVVNVINGARHRLSTMSSGVFLAIIILAIPDAIGLVPVACLTGILFIIVFKTFHWNSFILLFQLNWADSVNIIMVTALAVTTNLAIAIGAGVVWRALVHSFATSTLLHVHTELVGPDGKPVSDEEAQRLKDSHMEVYEVSSPSESTQSQQMQEGGGGNENEVVERSEVEDKEQATKMDEVRPTDGQYVEQAPQPEEEEGQQQQQQQQQQPTTSSVLGQADITKVYYVHGPLFFGSVTTFRMTFTPVADPHRIVIDLTEALVSDFSGVSAIRAVCKRYKLLSKTVAIRGLDAHSRGHVHRNPKLRPLTTSEAVVGVWAEGERPSRAGTERHETDGIGSGLLQDEREQEPKDLEHLWLFQPQGDELHHSEVELTASQARDALVAEGIEIEESDDSADSDEGAGGHYRAGNVLGRGDDDSRDLRHRYPQSSSSRRLSGASHSPQVSII